MTHSRPPVPQATRTTPAAVAQGRVIIVCPGGLEAGGGIGRQMGYFLRIAKHNPHLRYQVADSRGPWFLGGSPFHTVLSVFYLMRMALRMVGVRLDRTPVLLHINITGRGSTIRKIIVANWARLLRLKYFLHVHDYDYAAEYRRHGKFARRLIASIFQASAAVIVLGSRDDRLLSEALNLEPGKITILPNAVPHRVSPSCKDPSRKESCGLLFLGHLSERKGVSELLKALARPELATLQWHATLAGGGNVEGYQRLAADLGIAERVEFTGWINEERVAELGTDSDVLVLPSHAEGLAMAVLEGMAHGLAIITTPVGAHPEVIDDTISGLLIEPGDVAGLAGAIRRVVEDEGFRRQLGAAARHRFERQFEVSSYAERLCALHLRCIGEQV